MAAMKRQIYEDANKGLLEVEEDTMALMRESFNHPDSKEGISSYVEKRSPNFQGLTYGKIHDQVVSKL